ncbi:virulence factor [Cronobacter sakazakii]|uniref:virulence factor SrfC family protein n=1 Tax=Cronobacter sakazakii TaxID=28141 RepID=UPI000CF0C4B0|nr:virulence factor SrfC family protein [Cronobacter sakazakii]EGT5184774.1 virulence factor [Cronobacter sakazakii]EGT5765870.1 virulence factor [Cronobacter sakazakii]EJG0742547.1 virulence factor [Cronobacter sakazakii]EJG0746611.1 virulence factor [Cronobacter sakazakii]ELY2533261.1 virulence factor [Cronobacter sakazakii]
MTVSTLINQTLTTPVALTRWVETTRAHAPLLDEDAGPLLARLNALRASAQTLNALASEPRTLGLYGHSQAGKAHLLATLANGSQGQVSVAPGDKHLDWLTHINPGHSATAMAVRFTRTPPTLPEEFPLRLRLFSEAELVQIFLAHYQNSGQSRAVSEEELRQRLAQLQSLGQPQSHPAISAPDVMTLAARWRELTPARQRTLSDDAWYQLAELLPALNLPERVRLYALLWGDIAELTQQFMTLAEGLLLLGHAREVAAPLSLLVDNFSLPVEGFLLPAGSGEDALPDEVLVRALEQQQLQGMVSLPLTTLTLLCAELTLPLATPSVPEGVDLLDIPGATFDQNDSLNASKIAFLLDYYRQHQQPDVLMVCNAVQRRADIAPVARALLRWVNATQPASPDALPGLVWAITPHDARFLDGQHLDEGVQRLLGKPGHTWGTLQALDGRNLQRLTEWLSQALSQSSRERRLALLTEQAQAQPALLFSRYLAPLTTDAATLRATAENGVRTLQRQAARHGDLLQALLPDPAALQALCETEERHEETPQGLFSAEIDLFGESTSVRPVDTASGASLARRAHRLWVNHVRQWMQSEEHAAQLGIDPATLHWLGDTLIIASYRLDLAARLETLAAHEGLSGAQLRAELGNFVSWLGFERVPQAERPASRVNPNERLFASAVAQDKRLTRLGEKPVHAATRYVYDWLVALYTRAIENIGYEHPLDIKPADRKALAKIIGLR